MQRIDENTYIDDTLITCAEYQLFIDEMREQGKYCQPDHWASYQFLARQACSPILGVRFSDAQGFCDWLTGRKDGAWNYRLPAQREATDYPLHYFPSSPPLGYWAIGANGEHQFAWIGEIPIDPRAIDLSDYARHTLNDMVESYHNLHPHFPRARLTLVFQQALTRAHIRGLDDFFSRYISRDLGRTQTDRFALVTGIDYIYMLTLAISGVDHDHILDGIIDQITLQERIARQSPAFEGIRLVKERLK